MSSTSQSLPELDELVALFYDDAAELGQFERVSALVVPEPFRRLLAHNAHMTVTVEEYHGCKVDVRVLVARKDGDLYSRKILLTRQSDGAIVMFGVPRLKLSLLRDEVRREIESQRIPLGRVLIEHNVLREVQLVALWKIAPGPDLCRLLGVDAATTIYGRTALIHCDGEPAVELLEIVAPV